MITLKQIQEEHLKSIWKLGYTEDFPEWAQYNAPYFNEYRKMTFDEFLVEEKNFFLREKYTLGIFYNDECLGSVSYHWLDQSTQWLEIGIAILSNKHWNQGIGKKSLTQFIDIIFKRYPQLEHIGLTTWSGNKRMMNLALSLNMKEEARIRKVRYYNNTYYDSMKYGILREEYYKNSKEQLNGQ